MFEPARVCVCTHVCMYVSRVYTCACVSVRVYVGMLVYARPGHLDLHSGFRPRVQSKVKSAITDANLKFTEGRIQNGSVLSPRGEIETRRQLLSVHLVFILSVSDVLYHSARLVLLLPPSLPPLPPLLLYQLVSNLHKHPITNAVDKIAGYLGSPRLYSSPPVDLLLKSPLMVSCSLTAHLHDSAWAWLCVVCLRFAK